MTKIATRTYVNSLRPVSFSSSLTKCVTYSEVSGLSNLTISGSYSNAQLVMESSMSYSAPTVSGSMTVTCDTWTYNSTEKTLSANLTVNLTGISPSSATITQALDGLTMGLAGTPSFVTGSLSSGATRTYVVLVTFSGISLEPANFTYSVTLSATGYSYKTFTNTIVNPNDLSVINS